jgi:hypothetical protein
MAIWNILMRFWKFYGHLVQFVFIWFIFPFFGIMCQGKSGNPVGDGKEIIKLEFSVTHLHAGGSMLRSLFTSIFGGKKIGGFLET